MPYFDVRVQPKSSQEKVVPLPGGGYKVYVHAAADRGKANEAVIRLMAEQLNMPPSTLEIVRGQTSRHKVLYAEEE